MRQALGAESLGYLATALHRPKGSRQANRKHPVEADLLWEFFLALLLEYVLDLAYRTGDPDSAVLPGVCPYFFSINHCFRLDNSLT